MKTIIKIIPLNKYITLSIKEFMVLPCSTNTISFCLKQWLVQSVDCNNSHLMVRVWNGSALIQNTLVRKK